MLTKIIVAIFIVSLLSMNNFSQNKELPELKTVKQVDLKKYAGLWYEIAKIPNSFQDQCAYGTTLTAVGSLTPEEGHEYLLEAIAKLPDRTGLRVRIVDDGPCARDLGGRAHDLGVADIVEFLGRRDDVPSLLAQSDIFVLPSLIEGLPIALLEAMAAGKACVATAVGDVARAVDHEATGLLIPSADSAALASAIQRLVPDRGLRERLGEAARERVMESFSSRRMVRDYCRLYDDLIPRR